MGKRVNKKNGFSFGQTVYRAALNDSGFYISECEIIGLKYENNDFQYLIVDKMDNKIWISESAIFKSVDDLVDDLRKKVS